MRQPLSQELAHRIELADAGLVAFCEELPGAGSQQFGDARATMTEASLHRQLWEVLGFGPRSLGDLEAMLAWCAGFGHQPLIWVTPHHASPKVFAELATRGWQPQEFRPVYAVDPREQDDWGTVAGIEVERVDKARELATGGDYLEQWTSTFPFPAPLSAFVQDGLRVDARYAQRHWYQAWRDGEFAGVSCMYETDGVGALVTGATNLHGEARIQCLTAMLLKRLNDAGAFGYEIVSAADPTKPETEEALVCAGFHLVYHKLCLAPPPPAEAGIAQ